MSDPNCPSHTVVKGSCGWCEVTRLRTQLQTVTLQTMKHAQRIVAQHPDTPTLALDLAIKTLTERGDG